MMLLLLVATSVSAARPATVAPVAATPGPHELLAGAEHAIAEERLDQARLMVSRAMSAGASGTELARVLADLAYAGGKYDEAALRYASVCERLLARDEAVTLVVCHEIPVRYLANAAAGSSELNGPVSYIANATPYLFDERSLGRAAVRIRQLAG